MIWFWVRCTGVVFGDWGLFWMHGMLVDTIGFEHFESSHAHNTSPSSDKISHQPIFFSLLFPVNTYLPTNLCIASVLFILCILYFVSSYLAS